MLFEETIRELRRLEGGQRISVPISYDAEGYFDRKCPSSKCRFQFKIHADDWLDKVRDEKVFCPFCGHTASSDKWSTQEQVEYVQQASIAHIQQRIGHAMRHDADQWNRCQPRDSFFGMTMAVDSPPRHAPSPPAAAEPMQLKITCPECTCRYAVIGAAFFCPACGHKAAELVFNLTLTEIRKTFDDLPAMRAASSNRDTAENTVRFIVENGLQTSVTAFQRYAETLCALLPAAQQIRRNAFQNLAEGSNLWHAATGKHYSDHLDPAELVTLKRAFQQRHLLAHIQGFVDQDYITRSGDKAYHPEQRLVIREAFVRQCVDLVEKLAAGMASDTKDGGIP